MCFWVLQKKHRLRIWQEKQELWISTAISQIDCALLLSPDTMGTAHGSARAVHMDTCKESTEELWHFSSGRVSCAWSTLESLKYPLSACWNPIHNKEEIEQWNDCNAFLLEHPAAEARSPGSSKNLCWTTGMEFEFAPRGCPSAWVNVGEAEHSVVAETPMAMRREDGLFFLTHGAKGNHALCKVSLPLHSPLVWQDCKGLHFAPSFFFFFTEYS